MRQWINTHRQKVKHFFAVYIEKHLGGTIFDGIDALYYYRRKQNWYKNTYWNGRNIDDYCSPNGIASDSNRATTEGKEHFIIRSKIILNAIQGDGNILDLGCGNGLLLKYIIKKSPYSLTPFGVDFMGQSIIQAKKLFPNNRNNFIKKNILNYRSHLKFQYIVFGPEYIRKEDFTKFLIKCNGMLSLNGKIIIIAAPDAHKQFKDRLPILEELFGSSIKVSNNNGFYSVIIEALH